MLPSYEPLAVLPDTNHPQFISLVVQSQELVAALGVLPDNDELVASEVCDRGRHAVLAVVAHVPACCLVLEAKMPVLLNAVPKLALIAAGRRGGTGSVVVVVLHAELPAADGDGLALGLLYYDEEASWPRDSVGEAVPLATVNDRVFHIARRRGQNRRGRRRLSLFIVHLRLRFIG